MFNRVSYKKAAKQDLKGHWKVPVLVTLIYTLISLVISFTGNESDITLSYLISTILTVFISGMLEMALICYFFDFISLYKISVFAYVNKGLVI